MYKLLLMTAASTPERKALVAVLLNLPYVKLAQGGEVFAHSAVGLCLARQNPVAVWLFKRPGTVFGVARADCAFVPIGSPLKAERMAGSLTDRYICVLATTRPCCSSHLPSLPHCVELRHTIRILGASPVGAGAPGDEPGAAVDAFGRLPVAAKDAAHCMIDTDKTANLFRSWSTGRCTRALLPFCVVAGAHRAASCLNNVPETAYWGCCRCHVPAGDRVSPIEIEEVLCRTHLVPEAATFGVKRPTLGQVIVALMRPAAGAAQGTEALRTGWRRALRRCLLSAASTGTKTLCRATIPLVSSERRWRRRGSVCLSPLRSSAEIYPPCTTASHRKHGTIESRFP